MSGRPARPSPIRGRPDFDDDVGVASERNRERPAAAHKDAARAVLTRRWASRLTEAGIELDRHVDRPPPGGEPAHEHCRGQEATGEFGHHPFGERELRPPDVPDGLEGRGAGPVAPR